MKRDAETAQVRASSRAKKNEAPVYAEIDEDAKPMPEKKTKVSKKETVSQVADETDISPAKSPQSKTVKKLAVGDQVPDLTLHNQDGNEVNLLAASLASGLVIFFYPKANTPGCTTQACLYRDQKADFASKGYSVYGCSADTPAAQKKWIEKHGLGYELLCDREFKLISTLGIKKGEKSIVRSHVVIEKGGRIAQIVNVSPKESVTKALELIEGL